MTAASEVTTPSDPAPGSASRRWRLIAPWLALAALLALSLSVVAVRSAPDDSAAARAGRLTRELRCPTCQGLSVADSNDPSSEAIRADVRERIEAGESDGEIRASYVALYGETILLRPEGGGLGAIVWGLPVAVLVAGAGGIAFALRRGRAQVHRPGGRRRIIAVAVLTIVAAGSGAAIAVTAGDRTPGGAGSEARVPSRDERRARCPRRSTRLPTTTQPGSRTHGSSRATTRRSVWRRSVSSTPPLRSTRRSPSRTHTPDG
ncbi:MAG: cytochrome c-type biogenesis protein CcmH [Acidimicrobiia bacterium]|nr:cytochrome c-type biogenesis protein CcmH [Acidimicrobiia bacterium]